MDIKELIEACGYEPKEVMIKGVPKISVVVEDLCVLFSELLNTASEQDLIDNTDYYVEDMSTKHIRALAASLRLTKFETVYGQFIVRFPKE